MVDRDTSANRMLGYLNGPEETAAAFCSRWYATGDIVRAPHGAMKKRFTKWFRDRGARWRRWRMKDAGSASADQLPLLGAGKVDLGAIKRLAAAAIEPAKVA